MDPHIEANLRNWDERVAGHMAPDGYAVDELVNNPNHLTGTVRFDAERIGPVDGRRLLHSQCHIGTDTLSWARLGARVTGFDFSPKAIAAARSIAERMDVDATFVESEVAHAGENVEGEFDIVYTSVGAICWLPDLTEWATVLVSLLAPGGVFHIRDTHPMLATLDDRRDDDQLVVTYPYFHDEAPINFPDTESYLGSATLTNVDAFEWMHSISDVINALIGAGLTIERVDEHDHLDWQFMSHMEADGETWRLPPSQRRHVPLQFSVHARKPDPEQR